MAHNSTFASRAASKQIQRGENKAVQASEVKSGEPTATAGLVCDACGFQAKTQGGLASHARKHEDE